MKEISTLNELMEATKPLGQTSAKRPATKVRDKIERVFRNGEGILTFEQLEYFGAELVYAFKSQLLFDGHFNRDSEYASKCRAVYVNVRWELIVSDALSKINAFAREYRRSVALCNMYKNVRKNELVNISKAFYILNHQSRDARFSDYKKDETCIFDKLVYFEKAKNHVLSLNDLIASLKDFITETEQSKGKEKANG